ncbi:hypothetical protein [Desulfofustis glycolicus]|uniref:hypothetical protein n=1 Tax=Desulfofustis glycolicus TaxID=51195 RepID=UPI0009333973|nr:hypothetical protein [Desulfofustis glycolicus]MCB2217093.1 hypothetical protein [Desulfobulbaceae bacterium]
MPDGAHTALPVPSFFFSDDFLERRYKTGKNSSSSTVAKQIGPVNLKEFNDLSGQTLPGVVSVTKTQTAFYENQFHRLKSPGWLVLSEAASRRPGWAENQARRVADRTSAGGERRTG